MWRPHWGLPVVFGLCLTSCDGCKKTSTEPVSALRYVAKDAEAVLEIRDLGALVRVRNTLRAQFAKVVTGPQVEQLQKELTLTLGFDPSTPEGLTAAGLPAKGNVAVQIVEGGRGALWVVPVKDPQKFRVTLDKIVKNRARIDAAEEGKLDGHDVVRYARAFGDQNVPVATAAMPHGFALIGLGKSADTLVSIALKLAPGDAVSGHSEHQRIVQKLGKDWEVRMISPGGGTTMTGAIKTVGQTVPRLRPYLESPEMKALIQHVKSAGWSLNMESNRADAKAHLHLDEEGLTKSKKIFSVGPSQKGVLAVNVNEAAAFIQMAGDPKALMALLMPTASPSRKRTDQIFAKVKRDLQIDVEQEVMPLLTGHGALAVGIGDLSEVSFRALMGNPMAHFWSAGALGVKDPKAAVALETRLEGGLNARGMRVVPRQAHGIDVRTTAPQGEGKPANVLIETMGFAGAWVLSNEPIVTDRVAANQAGLDTLGAKGGLYAELRFRNVTKALERFRYGNLPILYRAVAAKLVDTIRMLDLASVKVQPSEDGLQVEASLSVVPELMTP